MSIDHLYKALAKGDIKEAHRISDKLAPGSKTSFAKSLIELKTGNYQQAKQHLLQTLEYDPRHADAANNLAILFEQHSEYDNAEKYYRLAIESNPKHLDARLNFADMLRQLGRLGDAKKLLEDNLNIDPNHKNSIVSLAVCLHLFGNNTDANTLIDRVLDRYPNDPQALLTKGNLLYTQKRFEQAADFLEKALAKRPNHFATLNSLGAAYIDLRRLTEARTLLQLAQKIRPASGELLDNLGRLAMYTGDLDLALRNLNESNRLQPNMWKPKWHRSYVNLLRGDFAAGWDEFDSRFFNGEQTIREVPFPYWNGESLHDKKLLIIGEQGLGDEIMFASCIPDIITQAKNTIIECDVRLGPLFQRSFPHAEIIAGKRDATTDAIKQRTDIDYHISSGSLPRFFRRRREDYPDTPGFLLTDDNKTKIWKNRYESLGKGINIGISWKAGRQSDTGRNTDLHDWKPILETTNCNFINLQYGDCADEIATIKSNLGITIHHWSDSTPLTEQDFFASQIQALDLVISVSNATVHLAGAIGKTTWTLLPFYPSWRWTFKGSKALWYSSVTLFRQPEQGQWSPVIQQIALQLNDYIANERITGNTKNKSDQTPTKG